MRFRSPLLLTSSSFSKVDQLRRAILEQRHSNMTEEQIEDRKSPGFPPIHKKSYNIVDILNDKKVQSSQGRIEESLITRSPSDINNNHQGSPTTTMGPYSPLLFNPSRLLPLLTNVNVSSAPSPPQYGFNGRNFTEEGSLQFQNEAQHPYFIRHQSPLVTSSSISSSHTSPGSTDFSGNLGGQGGVYPLGGLGTLPNAATLFQSPNYISLLLANPFVQPYLQNQHRFQQDFYAYNGRPFGMGSKRKGGQVRFAAAQTARLEKEFMDHKYLHANDRKRLAQALKLTDRQVKTWFQNRRAKWRKVGVLKAHRSESHVSASFGIGRDEREEGYSPDEGRCVSVSSVVSEDSS